MERLTNKREADAQREEYERRLANGYPRNIPEERFLRLAAYEDTGREPEEITAMQHTLDEYHKVADPLLRAQADGRLMVLPCGGSINLVECGRTLERPPQSWCYVEDF